MVHAPDKRQEAGRELTRCRQVAQENLKRVRHQLSKYLTRHGYIYADGFHWTQKHLCWLRSLEFEQLLLRDVFDSYFTEMQHCIQRLTSLDKEVEKLAESESYKEVVGFLRCFHGIDTLTAITMITEIFDFGRFSSPGELMSYLGLTSSENSSGQKERKGPITKAGNKRVRRLLVETFWHYRHPCNISSALKQRRKDQPQWVIDIADRAGLRLRKRYWHLVNKGKMPCKVTVRYTDRHGRRRWENLGHSDKRKAEKQREKIEKELRMGYVAPGSMRLRDFVKDSFMRTGDQIRESTRKDYGSAMTDLIKAVGNIDFQRIQQIHGELFRQARLDQGG